MADSVIDTYKKALEAQRDASLKVIDDMIDAINKEADANDYKKKLSDAQKDRQKIQDEIDKLAMDNSASAIKKKTDLMKQLSDANDSVTGLQDDHSKQARLDNLNNQKDIITSHYDDIINNEAKFAKMRQNIVNMNITQIQKDLLKFSKNIQANSKILGVNVANNLIALINKANGYVGNVFIKPIKPITSLDTGGFTGAWGSNGKMAMLHEKELVLNKTDTSNFLQAVNITRDLVSNLKLPDFSKILNPTASTGGGNTLNLNFNVAKMSGSQSDVEYFMNQIKKGVNSLGVKF
jgi:hypothetical protein